MPRIFGVLIMPNFLKLLFFTEMWERFSYYGMRALLVLFLVQHLGFSDPAAYSVYALFAAIGYAGPVVGGIFADRFVGFRVMIIIGGIIIALGHSIMLFMGDSVVLLYLGLGFIAVGTGFFKGNITNLLGSCYKKDAISRVQGFTLFHVGINLGSTLAGISCGIVASIYGWHYGFGLAGIGMLLGLGIFIRFQHVLGSNGLPPRVTYAKSTLLISLLGLAAAVMVGTMLCFYQTFSLALSVVGLGVFIYLGFVTMKCSAQERKNIILLLMLTIFVVFFFAFEMQLGSLFNLFTQRNIDRTFFGFVVPAAISQSINPGAVIIFGPIIARLFMRFDQTFAIQRFGIGIVGLSVCFAILYLGCVNASAAGLVSYGYLFAGICFMSIGELCIVPVIHNLYTLLSPPKMRGFFMGIFMLSLSFANLASNLIMKYMALDAGGISNASESLLIYQEGFLRILYFSIGFVGVFLLLMRGLIKDLNRKA